MSSDFRFCPYETTENEQIPNIVIDGSPNASTVLTLTHWPGIAQPAGMAADLSAQMAFRYLDHRPDHPPASVVTNNHFDQDGLVGVTALIDPERSQQHRDLLIDVAAGGDFATYRHRDAARASMTIWALANPDRSPLGAKLDGPYPEVCGLLYEYAVPLLMPMVLEPERFKEYWQHEDGQLTAAEQALADGSVTIDELPELSFAVVRINADLGLEGGHRFAAETAAFIHPMAVNNNTLACRLLFIRGQEYLYLDRYETWVQYQTREFPKRVDMAPLAAQLNELETGKATWTAGKASSLTPRLQADMASSISNSAIEEAVVRHLRDGAGVWDPFDWS